MRIILLQTSFLEQLITTLGEQSALFIASLPKFLGAIALLIFGRWFSRVISRLIKKMLEKIGVDKLADRLNDIDLVSSSKIDIRPSAVIQKIVYYLLFFVFILLATDILGMQPVTDLINKILGYIPNLVSAFIVFIIGLLLADFLKKIVYTACSSLAIPAAGLISKVVFYFLFLNVTMITLAQAKVETAFIEENLSILLGGIVLAFAIGYGFASRPILANLLTAYYSKDKISIGDQINIDGVQGEITAMDNSSFTVVSEDITTVIPLHKLSTEKYQIARKIDDEEESQS